MRRVSALIKAFAMVILVVLLAAPLPAAEKGEKPEKLIYASIPDMTGPYAAIVGPAYAAFQDAAQYVNSNGGVKGVPIEALVRDCGGKVDKGLNIYMQFREMDPRPSMIYGVLSGLGEALKERMNEDQIPGMWVCSTEVVYPPMYIFGAYPTYADLCGLFFDWVAETWKKDRAPRVAFLTWDTTYGKAVIYPAVMEYAKSKGIEIVATELFGVRDVDLTSQMTRIRAKKPDWIFTNTAGRGPVLVAKAVKEMGLDAKVAGSIGLDDSCLYIDKEVFEGAVTIHPFANWSETDNEGVRLMNKWMKKNDRPKNFRTIMYPMGFTGVLVFKKVVENIVDAEGWGAVNGKRIKSAMENLKDFNAHGIATFSYTKNRHYPNMAKVLMVKEGKLVPVTELRECPNIVPAKYSKFKE